MSMIRLAGREATQLWAGDIVVAGATLGGLAACLAARETGRSVCLVETGPTLGTDLSAEWNQWLPEDPLISRLRQRLAAWGAPSEGPVDIVLGTVACDQLVDEAHVDAYVKVLPARLLRDHQGVLTGLEVVGKSGRQSIQAPTVIDATPGQRLVRRELGMAAVRGRGVVRRCYVAGLDLESEESSWEVPGGIGVLDDQVTGRRAAWPGEAVLSVRLSRGGRSDSDLHRRSLEALTESIAWLRRHVAAFECATLVEVAPAFGETDWEADATVDPPFGSGLYALPGAAAELPARLRAGRECGLAALPAGKALPATSSESVTTQMLATRELSSPADRDLTPMTLPPAIARLHEPRDVVVAGYGTGGAFAALAAAEQGVRVAVLDPASIPGGIGSAGRIHSYYHGLTGGMQDRLDEQVSGSGASLAPGVRGYHPVGRAVVISKALDREGLDVYSGHTVFGVVRDGDRVTGVLSVAADGYHLFPCQTAIDGTGDGDLAAAAGAPMALGRDGDGFPQPYSYTPTSVNGNELRHHNFDAGWVDPTDTADFSRAHFEGRAAIAERGPYTEDRHFCSLAPIIGLRESRFVRGPLTLTFDDFLDGKTYPDTLCSAFAHHDNHAMDYAEESEWSRRHVVMFGLWRFLCHGDVPYRALLPTDVHGLLMACRALSVDHDLHQLLRMQRDIQVIGEICGVAAAEAVRRGVPPHEVPAAHLKSLLEARGIQPRRARKVLDLPAVELLAKLSEDGQERGLAMWRLSRQAEQLDWEAFFEKERDELTRFCAAVAALVGGRVVPVAAEILRQTIRDRVTAPRLGVKSPDRYVVAALALAACRMDGIAETIGDILASESLDAPDVLLLLKALEQCGQPEGIDAIVRFLDANAENEFPMPLWGVDADHPTSFRPQVTIRAVRTLCALGRLDQGHRLIPYLKHPSLLLRRYARRVLDEIRGH